jgi:ribosome-associated protein
LPPLTPITENRLDARGPRASGPAAESAGATALDADVAAALIAASLDEDKAEDILTIDIRGKSAIADVMIIASGRSARHVGALADHLMRKLKDAGAGKVRVEGMPQADWVLLDAGDVIVHLFRPEVRAFYQIEKIWAPGGGAAQKASA